MAAGRNSPMAVVKDKQRPDGGEVYWIGPASRPRSEASGDPISRAKLAKKLGVGWPTLLYYELRGLTRRIRMAGPWVYHADEVDRVAFIVRCRRFGLPIADIHLILDGLRSAEAIDVARERCSALIERLQQS